MDFDVASFFIGIAVPFAVYLLYFVLKTFYNIFFPYLLLPAVDLHKKAGAKWAVVTGATDGIGKAYAFELAKKGFNIILISRTQSKLDKTRQEILDSVGKVEVETISFDFSTGDSAEYKPLIEALGKKEIGVLVNNVGGLTPTPQILHKMAEGPSQMSMMININILPPTILSAAVLPQMTQRRAGIIINISSAAAAFQFKEWAIYCASKKYVSWLTEILQREYSSSGVTVQLLHPFLVTTKLSRQTMPSFFGPNPENYVRQAVRSIGLAKETTGYITHQIQMEGASFTPGFYLDYMMDVKNKELREKAKEKWTD